MVNALEQFVCGFTNDSCQNDIEIPFNVFSRSIHNERKRSLVLRVFYG